jgi:hypothetical protein
MKSNLKSIALIAAIAVIVIGSVLAVSAAPPAGNNDSVSAQFNSCGDLRMDEYYACEYGGWHPTQEVAEPVTAVGVSCGELRADEYYACLSSGWRPAENVPVNAK